MVNDRIWPNFVIKVISNEGTASPYIARLMYGILTLRDVAVDNENRMQFDRDYDELFKPLTVCREDFFRTKELLDDYLNNIEAGRVVKLTHNKLEINSSIDDKLRGEFNSFINNGVRAFRAVQPMTKCFGYDTAFMYGKDAKFTQGIEIIKERDPKFADYLAKNRMDWANSFIRLRNEMEHDGWQLDEIGFYLQQNTGIVEIAMPQIMKMPFLKYMERTICQLMSYIENTIVHCMQAAIKKPVYVFEIPEESRDHANPVRFDITLEGFSSLPPWEIEYDSGDKAFLQIGRAR